MTGNEAMTQDRKEPVLDRRAIEMVDQQILNLKSEYTAGEEQLRALEARQRDLQNTLSRIAGAIQSLEEMKTMKM